MNRLRPWFFVTLGLALSSQVRAANTCKHAYEKVFPYDLPLASGQAYVNVHNEVRFAYDCNAASAAASSEAKAGVFDLNLNLLQASAKATAQQGQPATAEAQVLVLGFEVAREDLDLDTLLDMSISPEPELDVNGMLTVNIGPVPIPVKYGVTANAKLNVKGGTEGFGVALNLVPAADAQVYVQAGVDISIAQLIARGDVNLIDEVLDNQLALYFQEEKQGFIRFDATSESQLKALSGHVLIQASTGTGTMKKNYEQDLLRWDGYARNDVILDFSDRVVIRE